MTRRLADCPACGGKMVSHFEGCEIGAKVGVCAVCLGDGKNGRDRCSECGGSGDAPRGHRDAAYYAAISYDADSHRVMDGKAPLRAGGAR